MNTRDENTHDPARWLIDCGNSRVKCARMQGHVGEVHAYGYSDQDMGLLQAHVADGAGGGGQAWLASVASPERTAAVHAALQVSVGVVHVVTTQAHAGRLRIAYAEPSRLGVDRYLAMLAACERVDGPWLLVSAGSALTIDLLDRDGQHRGGLILPMPRHMRESLANNFSQLDVAEGQVGDFAIDTSDAIASGAQAALLGAVERSLHRAGKLLGAPVRLLITGGDAGLLADIDHAGSAVLPGLVLEGLARHVQLQEA